MTATGTVDLRRVEIEFDTCAHARTMPKHDDSGISTVYPVEPSYAGDTAGYLKWLEDEWKATGYCPSPGFYVAKHSDWIASLLGSTGGDDGANHYVVVGRDGYVELLANRFRWREWMWYGGRREDAPRAGPVVGSGEGER